MAPKLRLSPLQSASRSASRLTRTPSQYSRSFTSTSKCATDGVYRELTAMRTKMPFIDAFRAEQERKAGNAPPEKVEPKGVVNTTPKRMSESFHKVVSAITQI